MLQKINPEDFPSEKILAAQLLVNKDSNDMTDADIARECEVDIRTLWLKPKLINWFKPRLTLQSL